MAALVYALCAIAALVCAALLFRAYAQNQTRLLLWSGLCFVGLTVNNTLVFVDLVIVPAINPSVDLALWRHSAALAAMAALLGGLIWDSE